MLFNQFIEMIHFSTKPNNSLDLFSMTVEFTCRKYTRSQYNNKDVRRRQTITLYKCVWAILFPVYVRGDGWGRYYFYVHRYTYKSIYPLYLSLRVSPDIRVCLMKYFLSGVSVFIFYFVWRLYIFPIMQMHPIGINLFIHAQV